MRNLYYRKIRKADIVRFIHNLKKSYRVIGPVLEEGVIMFKEMEPADIPAGFRDRQSPGNYRLLNDKDDNLFSFSNGPDSFKRFLHPPVNEIFRFKKTRRGLLTETSDTNIPMAFFGMRSCDIKALQILDSILSILGDYDSRRKQTLIVGLNCLYAAGNCFCLSLGTGPEIRDGCDMMITELRDFLLIESVERGLEFLRGIYCEDVTERDIKEKEYVIERCKGMIKKSIKTKDLPERIYRNLEHSRWGVVAERCLACGNCTQVCPTCFCNSSFDAVDVASLKRSSEGIAGRRIRLWDSCFSVNFARVHGGNFRPSRRARYRHWLSHKFGYWIDQFGTIGCVGCGRCITWCPVGIDVTEELEALGK